MLIHLLLNLPLNQKGSVIPNNVFIFGEIMVKLLDFRQFIFCRFQHLRQLKIKLTYLFKVSTLIAF